MSDLPNGFYKAKFQPANGSPPVEFAGEVKNGWFLSETEDVARIGEVVTMATKGWVFTRDVFFEGVVNSMKEMIHA
jgi:hypothetical protein